MNRPLRRAQPLWYVGYGSNLSSERFQRYLDGSECNGPGRPPSRCIELPLSLYFAGSSKTWSGPVAFVGLASIPGETTLGRAYLVTEAQFYSVVARENGLDEIPGLQRDLDDLTIGQTRELDVAGKYNLLMRLPDIDDIRVVTVTTSRRLPRGRPPGDYVAVILTGLLECGLSPLDASRYLAERGVPLDDAGEPKTS